MKRASRAHMAVVPWMERSLAVLSLFAASGCSSRSAGADGAASCAGAKCDGLGADGGAEQGDAGDLLDGGVFTPAPHRTLPALTYGQGSVITSARLVTIVPTGDAQADQLFAFGDALVASDWFTAMGGEYGITAPVGNVNLTGPLVADSFVVSPESVRQYVNATLTAVPDPPMPDGHTIYLFFPPPTPDCQGHHTQFGDLGDAVAVAQRCGPAAKQVARVGVVASHEVAEAASDTPDGYRVQRTPGARPWEQTAWLTYNSAINPWQSNVENADLCEGARVKQGSFYVARSFSNQAAMEGGDPCAPALPIPYYSVSTDRDWYAAAAGTTVTIPLRGWSAEPTDDWLLTVTQQRARPRALLLDASIYSDREVHVGTATYPAINNRDDAHLTVTVPPSVASGSWVSFSVESFRLDDRGRHPAEEDLRHWWWVGVYVP